MRGHGVSAPEQTRHRRARDAAWLLPVLGSLALSATMLARTTLGRDEMASWEFARLSLPDLFASLRHLDGVLGPYYLFLHIWSTPSDAAAWIRLPSALAVAAAVGLLARYAARTWGPGAGVLSGCALAFHPVVVGIAVEARPYALALALCTWGTLMVLDPGPLRRRRYVTVMILAGALHLFAVLACLAHLAIARNRRMIVPVLVVWAAAVPMALLARSQKIQVDYLQEPSLATALEMVRERAVPGQLLWVGLATLAALSILAIRDPRSRVALIAGLCVVLVPAAALFIGSHLSSPILNGRYLITAPLGLGLLLGALAGAPRNARWWPALLTLVLVAVVADPVRSLHAPRINGADFPRLARILAHRATPGDELRVAVRPSQGGMPAGVAFYTGDRAFLSDILTGLPDGAPLLYRRTITGRGQSVPLTAASRRVWLVAVYGTKPARDAAEALRAQSCRTSRPRQLGELALYRAICPLGLTTTPAPVPAPASSSDRDE